MNHRYVYNVRMKRYTVIPMNTAPSEVSQIQGGMSVKKLPRAVREPSPDDILLEIDKSFRNFKVKGSGKSSKPGFRGGMIKAL